MSRCHRCAATARENVHVCTATFLRDIPRARRRRSPTPVITFRLVSLSATRSSSEMFLADFNFRCGVGLFTRIHPLLHPPTPSRPAEFSSPVKTIYLPVTQFPGASIERRERRAANRTRLAVACKTRRIGEINAVKTRLCLFFCGRKLLTSRM